MKRLLVTGGCGFIGSNFVRYFLKSRPDWGVLNLDKLSYSGNLANLSDLKSSSRYEFVRGDIADKKLVLKLMKKVSAVAHFAAETHVDRSIEAADDFLKTNILGTAALLEVSLACGIKRFVHMSTDEVYGSIAKGHVDETAPLLPNSPYSASKAGADLLVRSFQETYGHPAMIMRCTNNFGPYQFPEKVIPLFVTNLLEGKTVPLYGNGKNRRDWIYVEDACRGLLLVLEKGKAGEIYNMGAHHEMNNLELTGSILRALKKDRKMIRYVPDRLGHDLRYAVNFNKLKRLGFRPAWSFSEGLAATVKWYKENPDWWKPLKRDQYTVKS
ncbi:MAG TPA: dTDP-glucose 4,6-dehydratase [Candidatus Omnitrophota bacterium]|nr:dTDP-glucose 4,6-dehydratase [Candidatus Omnitrophota bacterium]HRY85366.1 dTDP-glucose 4,6-dehydratase [Candidatus Omnitrophota bacterium]